MAFVVFVGVTLGCRTIAQRDAVAAMRMNYYDYKAMGREAFPSVFSVFLKEGKYKGFVEASFPAFAIPELGRGFVPQGLCYCSKLNAFLLTMYASDRESASVLVSVDADTGVRTKTLSLRDTAGFVFKGHAGGVVSGGGDIYVASEAKVYHLSADTIRSAADGDSVQFDGYFKSVTAASNIYIEAGVLWVGEYYANSPLIHLDAAHRDKESGNRAWAAGYKLQASGFMGVKGVKRSGDQPVPAYLLSLPRHVQGIGQAADGRLLFSCSKAAALPSELLVYPPLAAILQSEPDYQADVLGTVRPLWVLGENSAERLTLPPMSEGLALYKDSVCILFESAASIYRPRAELFADHVYALNVAAYEQGA
ncbi:MAG: hypothetical protein LBR73_00075 [Oscillospiraceae bacterium]|jgi:hypothetical protein|nr:hypothetical protein [Oscillospiraceae bacterium]